MDSVAQKLFELSEGIATDYKLSLNAQNALIHLLALTAANEWKHWIIEDSTKLWKIQGEALGELCEKCLALGLDETAPLSFGNTHAGYIGFPVLGYRPHSRSAKLPDMQTYRVPDFSPAELLYLRGM